MDGERRGEGGIDRQTADRPTDRGKNKRFWLVAGLKVRIEKSRNVKR